MDIGRDYCKPPAPILHLRLSCGRRQKAWEQVNWQLGCIPAVALGRVNLIITMMRLSTLGQALARNAVVEPACPHTENLHLAK
ncbi:hypothetical protein BDFG_04309 [Blastomyces dermatitidis ATCC 26199]|nr:hypothetical protein BDFG_04309 [Blastomyces dermatitidis ATCC 26199]